MVDKEGKYGPAAAAGFSFPSPPLSAAVGAVAVAVFVSVVVLHKLEDPQGEGRGPSLWDVHKQRHQPYVSLPPLARQAGVQGGGTVSTAVGVATPFYLSR